MKQICSLMMCVLVIAAFGTAQTKNAKSMKLDVAGLNCENCVKKVEKALKSVDGVSGVNVNLEAGTVDIANASTKKPSTQELMKAVADAGYKAAPAVTLSAETKKEHHEEKDECSDEDGCCSVKDGATNSKKDSEKTHKR